MRLIFVRHPQTEANAAGLIYGRLDALYSRAGRESIPAIVESLREVEFDALLASPLTRTRLLAEEIARDHGFSEKDIRFDDRIIEMNFGVLEGLTTAEAQEQRREIYESLMADYEGYVLPQGESCMMVYERAGKFLTELYEEFEERASCGKVSVWGEWSGEAELSEGSERGEERQAGRKQEKTIVVVAHSMVIHMALAQLLKIDPREIWHIKVEPGSIVDIDWRCNFAMLQGLSGPFQCRACLKEEASGGK